MKLIKVEETTHVDKDENVSTTTKRVYEPDEPKGFSQYVSLIVSAIFLAVVVIVICLIKA